MLNVSHHELGGYLADQAAGLEQPGGDLDGNYGAEFPYGFVLATVLGWTSGGALCVLLRLLLDGEPLEKAANSMIEFIETKPECKQLVPYLKRAVETARLKERGCDAFIKLGEGWVAEEALAIGLWSSLLNSTDTCQALLDAVNHSGDSDSTGAIAGYIVGAANGVESIPKEWLEHLELRDLIEEQVNDLLKE